MNKPQKVLVAGVVIIFLGSIVYSRMDEIVGSALIFLGVATCLIGPLAATIE